MDEPLTRGIEPSNNGATILVSGVGEHAFDLSCDFEAAFMRR
jgi:hypothetical protein